MENEAVIQKFTTGVAAGGVTLPVWFQTLEQVSWLAADLVPLLSALWLVIQICGYARKWWRGAI